MMAPGAIHHLSAKVMEENMSNENGNKLDLM